MLVSPSITIVHVVFMLALIGFALWKTTWIRVILSLGVLIWGTWATEYDIKVAAPLMAIGGVLFFLGMYKIIRLAREGAPPTMAT